jgi:peptidyl-prolyl cis-trans isomerase D
LQQVPYFRNQQTGQFDSNMVVQFLQMIEADDFSQYPEEALPQLMEMKRQWLETEQQIINYQLRRKFSALVASSILTNDLEAKAAYEDSKTSVDFNYVAQAYSVVPDDAVTVTDAEIKKLYDERKEQFKQEEGKLIDFVTVYIAPSQDDYKAISDKLATVKETLATTENIAEVVQNYSDVPYINAYLPYSSLNETLRQFVNTHAVGDIEGPVLANNTYTLAKFEGEKTAPDSVKLNLLMLPASLDEKQTAQITDSLLQVIKSGKTFAEVAQTTSNGQTNGEIGWMTEAQLIAQTDVAFTNQIFNAALNTPQVAKASIGTFLVEVTEKTAPVKKYHIANIQERVIASQDTKTKIYNDISQFVSTNRTSASWKENAAKAGLTLQSDVEVEKEQINLNGIQSTRQIIQWAFNNKKSAISDIYEVQNSEYFVAATVVDNLPKGYRSLASVSDFLKRELLNEKKGEKLVADLKAKKLSSLEQYAEAFNTTPQEVKFLTFATPSIAGIGAEPVLNVKVPQQNVNTLSAPIAGKNRVYVVQVTDKRTSTEPFNAESQKAIAQMQNTYRVYQIVQNPELLRENAKIENNFSRFY